MTGRHDISVTLPWLREGTTHLLSQVAKLTDDEFRTPSLLPGWTRGHVIAHVARNAEALGRLVDWARTGVESRMYSSAGQRADEIARTAAEAAPILRQDAASTAQALDHSLAQLSDEQWHRQIRSALGRVIPAAEVPWLRIREVWLHAVDIDTGATVHDIPADIIDLLLDDVTTTLSAKPGCPCLVLAPTDRERAWALGGAGQHAGPHPAVRVPAATTAGWLTGRPAFNDLPISLPPLPAWL
ncbi:maleylpyruvate isomerase family mycothiol-dependent enzyme [Pseudofrankia sp. DC12]|uniref:maleylpyruvate isomerase family mycothiol-dependent enzyme n=1 Tax=Pseudofrankia sp. DC12 TaxID=683315 RepID=UPI0005F824EB|nr:maleylpyruvate isomerase family mycothiol-dependent enzyme [Pseudofrankia sp. DC12]